MKPLAVVTVAPNYSPRAYTGGRGRARVKTAPAGGLPILAHHEFVPQADGTLEHYIDGRLRATVAPDQVRAYAETWPECAELARTLSRAAA